MTREIWKRAPGEPNYDVSNKGRVRNANTKHILKPVERDGRRLISTPRVNGKQKQVRVHRLVLLAFRGPPPVGKPYGTHRDGNPANNVLTNLRWASQKENCQDAIIHGTQVRGETCGKSKLTDKKILDIRRLYDSGSHTQEAIAADFGVTQNTVSKIVNGKTWAHVSEKPQ